MAAARQGKWRDVIQLLESVRDEDANRCKALYLMTVAAANERDIESAVKFGDLAWRCRPALEKPLSTDLVKLRNWSHGVQAGLSNFSAQLTQSSDRADSGHDLLTDNDGGNAGLDSRKVEYYRLQTKAMQGFSPKAQSVQVPAAPSARLP